MKTRFLFILIFSLSVFSQAIASEIESVVYKNKGSIAVNAVTPLLKIIDPFYGTPGVGYKYKVRLTYTRAGLTDITSQSDWSYTLALKMQVKNNAGVQQGTDLTVTLKLDYKSMQNPVNSIYEDVYLMDYSKGAWVSNPLMELYVTNITPGGGTVPADISLELIQVKYNTPELFDPQLFPALFIGTDKKTISWSYVEYATGYELEWVYVDAKDLPVAFTNAADPFLYKEPVRIVTSCQSFSFHNTYSQGTIYFRVRAAGLTSSEGTIVKGEWAYGLSGITNPVYITNAADFEPLKNAQVTTAFAEEGKYSKAIQYFDGSMRARQTQTLIKSDNAVSVGETKYDYEGRPVVSVMPYPYKENLTLGYLTNANQFATNTKSAYDNATESAQMLTTSGAAKYYSDQNNFTSFYQRGTIASAGGYPYAQTVYANDNTGQVIKQGGVGAAFHLHNNPALKHYTETFYVKPSSTELHRMFGPNVGDQSHYSKVYSLDENGQYRVAYLDMQQKTIATAMLEKITTNSVTAPNNLLPITDAANSGSLYPNNKSIHRLSDQNEIDAKNHLSVSVDKIMNLLNPQDYTFYYDINGVIATLPWDAATCQTCSYTVEISITDPDGLAVSNGYYKQDLTASPSAGCSTATYPPLQFNTTFTKTGVYIVTKKLTYNTAAIQNLVTTSNGAPVSVTLTIGSTATTYTNAQKQQFIDAYKANSLAVANCSYTCDENCANYFLSIGVPNPTTTQLNDCKANCQSLTTNEVNSMSEAQCSNYKVQMLSQLSPDGYYYTQTGFIDAVFSSTTYAQINGVSPTVLDVKNPEVFISDWANNMFTKHPEYCVYTNMCENTTNMAALATRAKYESIDMAACSTWIDAKTLGYLEPIEVGVIPSITTFGTTSNPNTTIGKDPFPNATINNAVKNKLLNYFDENAAGFDMNGNGSLTTINAWEFASFYYRQLSPVPTSTPDDYDKIRWTIFKGIYLQVKEKAIADNMLSTGCSGKVNGVTRGFQDPTLEQTVIQSQQQLVGVDPSELENKIGNLTKPLNCTDDDCRAKADLWFSQLENSCSALAGMTETDKEDVIYNLFCFARKTCKTSNPYLVITASDASADPYLVKVKNILNLYGGCPLDPTIVTANPYTSCTNVANTTAGISTDFLAYIDLINEYLAKYRNTITAASGSCSDLATNPGQFKLLSEFPSGRNNSTVFSPYTDPFKAVLLTQTGNNIQMHFLSTANQAFYAETGLLEAFEGYALPISSLEKISNISITPGPYSIADPSFMVYFQLHLINGTTISKKKNLAELDPNRSQANYTNTYISFGTCSGQSVNATPLISGTVTNVIKSCSTATAPPYNLYTGNYTDYLNGLRNICIEQQNNIATQQANDIWDRAVFAASQQYLNTFYQSCFSGNFKENFYYQTEEPKQLYYTLYYYDQAGNLVQTVPPEGVRLLGSGAFNAKGEYDGVTVPAHGLKTTYKYNSLNQQIWKSTPDEGETYSFYDNKGRIKLSQNAMQRASAGGEDFVYVLYDNLGRTYETAKLNNQNSLRTALLNSAGFDANMATLNNNTFLPGSGNLRTEVTTTLYDDGGSGNATSRGRVSQIATKAVYTDVANTSAINYTYDIHGNVKNIVNTIPNPDGLLTAGFSTTVDYVYDLINGLVKEVVLDKDMNTQFIHQYYYDQDNRLRKIKTSRNRLVWEEDVVYFYGPDGKLAREELGNNKVQGLDYYYTLQGWIKGINSPGTAGTKTVNGTTHNYATADPGWDGYGQGAITALSANPNKWVASDDFGMALGFYKGDYTPIAGFANLKMGDVDPANNMELFNTFATNGLTGEGLYNGNIAYWTTNNRQLGGSGGAQSRRAQVFQYDQLDRLCNAYSQSGTAAVWAPRVISTPNPLDFKITNYDLNGNILNLKRYNSNGILMDDLQYNYTKVSGMLSHNKLNSITENAATPADDMLKNQTDATNYKYDASGNLTADVSEYIATNGITWNIQGKVMSLTRDITRMLTDAVNPLKPDLSFQYDASGKRIMKIVKPWQSNGTLTASDKWLYTFYSYDAGGNLMAVYNREYDAGAGTLTYNQTDAPIYASRRIGTDNEKRIKYYKNASNAVVASVMAYDRHVLYPGKKSFEVADHLRNVRSVVAGIKMGVDVTVTPDGVADVYMPYVLQQTDYYPFGAIAKGTSYRNNLDYRFGYNGKPDDNEWNGDATMYDYGFRIYDPRICKFLSVDPLAPDYPELTTYQFASNTPINSIDLDGLERYVQTKEHFADGTTVVTLYVYGFDGEINKPSLLSLPTGVFGEFEYHNVDRVKAMTEAGRYKVWQNARYNLNSTFASQTFLSKNATSRTFSRGANGFNDYTTNTIGGTNSNGILYIEKFANGFINYEYIASYKTDPDLVHFTPLGYTCPLERWGGPFNRGGIFINSLELSGAGGMASISYFHKYREGGEDYFPTLDHGLDASFSLLDFRGTPGTTLSLRFQGSVPVNKTGYNSFWNGMITDTFKYDFKVPLRRF